MPRLHLLANPAASSFTGGLHRDVMMVLKQGYVVEAVWPSDTADAIAHARAAAEDQVDVVVAMGGDGMVHHVANALVGSSTALGIIPAGTTNVLADILHIPTRPLDAAHYLLQAKRPQVVSTLEISLDGRPPVHATFAAGVGLDAEVVESAERLPDKKTHFGWIHYARSTLRVLWRQYRKRLPTMRAVVDGERYDAVTLLIQAHWPYSYFGKIPLSLANHPPGGMHVAAFDSLSLHRVADVGVRVLTGMRLERARGTRVFADVHEVSIEADPQALVQADGELLGPAGFITVRAVPTGLYVMAPAYRPEPKPVRTRRRLRKPR